MESTNEWNVGEFNEAGMVANFEKQGMEIDLSIKELIANSIDAGATIINFYEYKENVYLSDNGKGISMEENKHMFSAYRENHRKEKTCGVSGIGGKLATLNLSKDGNTYTDVEIHSNGTDGYLYTIIEWSNIMKDKKYTNRIKTTKMSDKDIEYFKSKLGNKTGTIYKFKRTENIQRLMKYYFKDTSGLTLDKTIAYVFGKFKFIDIQYNGVSIEKYDYFGGLEHEYIINEKVEIYLFEGTNKKIEYYINKDEKFYDYNYKKKKTIAKRIIGEPITLKIACRNERNNKTGNNKLSIYDLPDEDDGHYRISDYDSQYLNFEKTYDEYTECFAETQIIRNNQGIAGVKIYGYKHSSSRGSKESGLKNCGLRSELSYETTSEQSNILDRELGIQLNKNQHSKELPKELASIVSHMRKKYYNELIKKIKSSSPEPPSHEPSSPEPSSPEPPSPEQPTPEQPSPEQPLHEPSSPEQPSPEQPSHEPPSHEPPSPEQLSHEPSSPEQPSHEQPSPEPSSPEQPSHEQPGPIIPKHQKLPLSQEQLIEISEKIRSNIEYFCRDEILMSFYNKHCLN
jgi:hypothetical protein